MNTSKSIYVLMFCFPYTFFNQKAKYRTEELDWMHRVKYRNLVRVKMTFDGIKVLNYRGYDKNGNLTLVRHTDMFLQAYSPNSDWTTGWTKS